VTARSQTPLKKFNSAPRFGDENEKKGKSEQRKIYLIRPFHYSHGGAMPPPMGTTAVFCATVAAGIIDFRLLSQQR
jgi:hypothetical protein